MAEKQKVKNHDQQFIRFWGGPKLIFSLAVFIMIGILIMIFNQISFIFQPLQVIFSTIVAPLILAIAFFYILNPVVTWLEKKGLRRNIGTLIVFVVFLLLLVYGVFLLVPIIVDQVTSFVGDFPQYVDTLGSRMEDFAAGSFFESYYHDARESLDGAIGEVPS